MSNKVIADLGLGYIEKTLEERKDPVIDSIKELAELVREREAMLQTNTFWDDQVFSLENEFHIEKRQFVLINMSLEKRLGKIF